MSLGDLHGGKKRGNAVDEAVEIVVAANNAPSAATPSGTTDGM